MNRPTILLVATTALLVGFGIGHFVGSRAGAVAVNPVGPRHPIARAPVRGPGLAESTAAAEPAKITSLDQLRETLRTATEPHELAGEIKLTGGIDEIQAALRLCTETANQSLGAVAIEELCSEWAQTDPQAAIAYASTLANHATRRNTMLSIIQEWVEKDFTAAAAYVKQLPAGALRNQASQELPGKLAKTDPRAALGLINELSPAGYHRDSMFQSVFNTWSESAPAEAAAAALQLANLRDRRSAVASAVENWCASDAKQARLWAEALPEGPLRNQVLGVVIQKLGSEDPITAAQLVSHMSTGPEQYAAVSSLVAAWAETDAHAALSWLQRLPDNRGRRQAESILIARVVSSDPVAAAALIASLGSQSDHSYYNIANAWASTDLAKATQWATQLPAGPARRNALTGLCTPMVEANPQQALQFVLALPKEDKPAQLLSQVVSDWAEQDPQAARGWALSLTDRKMRADILPDLFATWANDDPEAATAAAARLPSAEQGKVAAQMAYALASAEPAHAAAWALQFPDLSTRAELVSVIGSQWAALDVAPYSQWTQSLPAGEVRDAAVYALASQLATEDPPAALHWVQTMQDRVKHDELLRGILTQWLESDPGAAQQWLSTAKLPPALAEQLKTQ